MLVAMQGDSPPITSGTKCTGAELCFSAFWLRLEHSICLIFDQDTALASCFCTGHSKEKKKKASLVPGIPTL